jgi:hypothetical protein
LPQTESNIILALKDLISGIISIKSLILFLEEHRKLLLWEFKFPRQDNLKQNYRDTKEIGLLTIYRVGSCI